MRWQKPFSNKGEKRIKHTYDQAEQRKYYDLRQQVLRAKIKERARMVPSLDRCELQNPGRPEGLYRQAQASTGTRTAGR